MSRSMTYENSWGNHIYRVGGEEIEDLKEVEIKGEKRRVSREIDTETVHDMGHSYEVASYRYYVTEDVHGAKVKIPLEQFIRCKKCGVTAVRYSHR